MKTTRKAFSWNNLLMVLAFVLGCFLSSCSDEFEDVQKEPDPINAGTGQEEEEDTPLPPPNGIS